MKKKNEWLVKMYKEWALRSEAVVEGDKQTSDLLTDIIDYTYISFLEKVAAEASRRKEIEILEWARDTAEIEPIIDAINARLEKI